jgi:hypothetical protein
LDLLDAATTEEEVAAIRAEIEVDREAALRLDGLFGAFGRAKRDC